jgi:hypothetical protein
MSTVVHQRETARSEQHQQHQYSWDQPAGNCQSPGQQGPEGRNRNQGVGQLPAGPEVAAVQVWPQQKIAPVASRCKQLGGTGCQGELVG